MDEESAMVQKPYPIKSCLIGFLYAKATLRL